MLVWYGSGILYLVCFFRLLSCFHVLLFVELVVILSPFLYFIFLVALAGRSNNPYTRSEFALSVFEWFNISICNVTMIEETSLLAVHLRYELDFAHLTPTYSVKVGGCAGAQD